MKKIQLMVLCLVFYLPCSVLAATGDITADPHFLILDADELGSTTISWNTSGTSTAQVWVSTTDDTNETLMAQGASGSVNAAWIRSEKTYIFSLYEGTTHSNLLNWMSVITHEPPASRLGFNYWPYMGTCQDLIDSKWTEDKKEEVKKDLDIMASYGTSVIRLMFWPQFSGYKLVVGGGGYFTSDFNEIQANLPELLGFCAQRDLKVIISFGNNFHKNGPNPPAECWWDVAYGTDHNAFLVDSATWIAGYVNAIENSQYRDVILCYDMETELNNMTRYTWVYTRYMYDNISFPKGKICLNPQRAAVDMAIARTELGNRRIDYIDFHTYPDLTNANNPDPQTGYNYATASFSDSVLVVGEYAGMGPDPQDIQSTTIEPSTEHTQQTTEVDFINWAFGNDIPYFCHWGLWDLTPNGGANNISGWGYEPHEPKDVIGKMAEMLSIVPNGDMEDLNDIEPADWSAGGTVSSTFDHNNIAATNSICARILANETSGQVWMNSSMVPVNGGRKLFLNCYVRTSMDNVYMGVREYDSSQSLIATNIGPRIASPAWQWYNYLHATIPWNVILDADTRYIEVVIGGDVRNNPSILDVDTVSVWESNMRTVKSDFNSDRTVGNDDLEALILNWLAESHEPGWNPRFNIASPPDEIINLSDFAAFGLDWLWQ